MADRSNEDRDQNRPTSEEEAAEEGAFMIQGEGFSVRAEGRRVTVFFSDVPAVDPIHASESSCPSEDEEGEISDDVADSIGELLRELGELLQLDASDWLKGGQLKH